MCRCLWCKCCTLGKWLFWIIVTDVIAFPFVHSFWNLIGFEGFFLD